MSQHQLKLLAETVTTELLQSLTPAGPSIIRHDLLMLDMRAQLALNILISSGMRYMTESRGSASEAATMACDLAKAAFLELENHGWSMDIPSYSEIDREARDNAMGSVLGQFDPSTMPS
jgi:hypothetical protein